MGAETHERILSFLNDMDAEAMPNEQRAEILAAMMTRATEEDVAWAASFAPLPPMPEVDHD